MHSDCLQELTLCSPSFIAVFLSVEIERRLDSRVTQDSLHCLRFDLRLVHQPVAKRVTKVVQSEPLTILDLHSGFLCRRSQMIGDENRRGEGNTGRRLEGWKNKIPIGGERRPCPPCTQEAREHGYVTARSHWSFLFWSRHPRRLPSVSKSESVLPPTVSPTSAAPASPKRGVPWRRSEHQREVKRRGEGFQNRKRLFWRDDNGVVVGLRARLDVQHGILRDTLMQDADLVDAAHDAPHLRNRRPGKTARLVERFEPPLNIEQLDVFRDFDSETRGETGAHDMLHLADGVGRFRAHRISPEIGSQIMLRKKIEPDAARRVIPTQTTTC